MTWETAALGAGGVGTVIVAFLAAMAAAKKLVSEIRGTPPEGQTPASLATIMTAATEAKEAANEAKDAATRAETKVDAHLLSHADSDVRTRHVRLVQGDRL